MPSKLLTNLLTKLLLPEAAGRWSVPSGARFVTRLAHDLAPVFWGLGHLETRLLRQRLARWPVDRPIYVCGIARAGTTITLELLHHHPSLATHRYYHLPIPSLPHWSSRLVASLPLALTPSVERIHADRLRITKDSPEMAEERVWMAYFSRLHSEHQSNVIAAETRNPRFERAYTDHIRKICMSQARARYAAKNNNLVTRLPYLRRLFPDARFVLIVRHPLAHVASLHKQHRLFTRLCAADPGLARYLAIAGHYEFGPPLRFINTGGDGRDRGGDNLRRIRAYWQANQFAQAWATYWASIYGHLAKVVDADPGLAKATHIVRYEDLCRDSGPTIDGILGHTDLDPAPFVQTRSHYVQTLQEPDYYRHDFSNTDVKAIEKITAPVAARYGY
jgi:Sulfotransferase family